MPGVEPLERRDLSTGLPGGGSGWPDPAGASLRHGRGTCAVGHPGTITFSGHITGGAPAPEAGHRYGEKVPRWFSVVGIGTVEYHPKSAVQKALDIFE